MTIWGCLGEQTCAMSSSTTGTLVMEVRRLLPSAYTGLGVVITSLLGKANSYCNANVERCPGARAHFGPKFSPSRDACFSHAACVRAVQAFRSCTCNVPAGLTLRAMPTQESHIQQALCILELSCFHHDPLYPSRKDNLASVTAVS